MEFRSNNSQARPARPAQTPARPNYEENTNGGATPPSMPRRSKKHFIIFALAVVLALVILFMAGMFVKNLMGAEKDIKGDKYQALFLTNGQVYFGHIKDIDHSYAKMTDIYYLQVQQSVQPEDKPEGEEQQPQVSLSKLGDELHGPEDAMHISRDQILFWENLKDDSKVVQAIKEHKK
jgi:hypothetical protein